VPAEQRRERHAADPGEQPRAVLARGFAARRERRLAAALEKSGLDAGVLRAIQSENAARFLGLAG
jgi:hypothetical protein